MSPRARERSKREHLSDVSEPKKTAASDRSDTSSILARSRARARSKGCRAISSADQSPQNHKVIRRDSAAAAAAGPGSPPRIGSPSAASSVERHEGKTMTNRSDRTSLQQLIDAAAKLRPGPEAWARQSSRPTPKSPSRSSQRKFRENAERCDEEAHELRRYLPQRQAARRANNDVSNPRPTIRAARRDRIP
jgi:hypothetical protein